jgi:hypothetical protein
LVHTSWCAKGWAVLCGEGSCVTCRPRKSHSHAWRCRMWGCEACQICDMLRRDGMRHFVTTQLLSRVVCSKPYDKITQTNLPTFTTRSTCFERFP